VHDDTLAAALLSVLVVGDHVRWIEVVADYFRREEVSVTVADNGVDALAIAEGMRPGMIILDADSPDVDVLELCRRLRRFSDAHIIMWTARADEATVLAGFAAGADDFLTQARSSRELAARIRAVLRRCRRTPLGHMGLPWANDAPRRVFGLLSIDVARREVFVADEQISLTRTQFAILAALAARAGAVITRQELVDVVWGPCWAGSVNTIDVHIGQLRRKLGDNPARPLLLLNVRGIGYRLASNL
jgi:DNA-binding response OmpR family regulator